MDNLKFITWIKCYVENVLLNENNNDGIENGVSGNLLLIYNYLQYFENEELECYFSENMMRLLGSLSHYNDLGFSNGGTGVALMLNYFIKIGIIDDQAERLLEEYDLKIYNVMQSDEIHSLSFSDGYLGLGCYIMQRIRIDILEDQNVINQLNLKEAFIHIIDLFYVSEGMVFLSIEDQIKCVKLMNFAEKISIYPEVSRQVRRRVLDNLQGVYEGASIFEKLGISSVIESNDNFGHIDLTGAHLVVGSGLGCVFFLESPCPDPVKSWIMEKIMDLNPLSEDHLFSFSSGLKGGIIEFMNDFESTGETGDWGTIFLMKS